MKKKQKKLYLQSKKRYLKKRVGTEEKPRLSIYRSHKHIYGQIINDTKGETLCSLSTLCKPFNSEQGSKATKAIAFKIGQKIGELAVQKSVKQVVFDCGSKIYHGRIESLADGARLAGLLF